MHGPLRARHRDIKLCLVRLAKRANRHADDDLVHTLALAGVTGDRYSLVEMKSGAIANDLALLNMILPSSMSITVRSSLLRNLCPRPLTFFVNRIGSLIDSDLLLLEHAELPCLVKWHLLLGGLFSYDDSSFLPAEDPLFAAFESAFPGLLHEQIHPKAVL
jgi:hypothetical protein